MQAMMKAVVAQAHGGPEVLQWSELPVPEPGQGEVVLRLQMTSVNFADIKARRAPYRHFRAPFVPGFDGVGWVEALGEGVEGLAEGQRVAAYVKGGSYATHALADARVVYPIDEAIGAEDAASIGVAITAYNALHWAARLQPSERVLIHAASGGVGSQALQLARLAGASQILATTRSRAKQAVCKGLGADVCLRLQDGESFAAEVLDATEGQGVDVILDTLGGRFLEQGLQCLADFGRLVIFGHSTSQDGQILSRPLHRHNRAVVGYSSGGYRKHKPALLRPTAEAIAALWLQGALSTHVGQIFPLERAAEAHGLFEAGENVGKILLSTGATAQEPAP